MNVTNLYKVDLGDFFSLGGKREMRGIEVIYEREELIHSSHKTLGMNPLRWIPALLQICAPCCPRFWKTFITPFLSKTLSFSPQGEEVAQTSGL